jgi:hypothetical protein
VGGDSRYAALFGLDFGSQGKGPFGATAAKGQSLSQHIIHCVQFYMHRRATRARAENNDAGGVREPRLSHMPNSVSSP